MLPLEVMVHRTLRAIHVISSAAALLAIALPASLAAAADYYVSTAGSDANDGLSEATSWRTLGYAGGQVAPGDTVHVKAGDYGADPLTVTVDGTMDAPIVFEGYQTVPGDQPDLGWSYPNATGLDATVMPLIDGGDRSQGTGVTLNGRSYVTLRNFQVRNFSIGVYAWGANHVTIENVIVRDLGDIDAYYDGHGVAVGSEAYDNVVRNAVVYNSAAEGITIVGDRNTVDGSFVYADDNTNVNSSTDYYIFVGGNDNIITGNYVERVGDLEHVGHGIGVKGDCTGNVFSQNEAVNMSGGFYVRHRGSKNNLFEGNLSRGGDAGILIRDGASENTFRNHRTLGSLDGISFMDTGEDDGAQWAGSNNTVMNSVFEDPQCLIRFHAYSEESPAFDNTFVNITARNVGTVTCAERTNYGNRLVNSILSGVDALESGPFAVDLQIEYTAFANPGFALPAGMGNIEVDPLFVDAAAGDLHLRVDSPCVDAGTADGAPEDDMDGVMRPWGAGFDMGAYEYFEPSGTTGGDTSGSGGTSGTSGGSASGGSASGGGADASGSGTGAATSAGSGGTDTAGSVAGAEGCTCTAAGPPGIGALLFGLLLLLGAPRSHLGRQPPG